MAVAGARGHAWLDPSTALIARIGVQTGSFSWSTPVPQTLPHASEWRDRRRWRATSSTTHPTGFAAFMLSYSTAEQPARIQAHTRSTSRAG